MHRFPLSLCLVACGSTPGALEPDASADSGADVPDGADARVSADIVELAEDAAPDLADSASTTDAIAPSCDIVALTDVDEAIALPADEQGAVANIVWVDDLLLTAFATTGGVHLRARRANGEGIAWEQTIAETLPIGALDVEPLDTGRLLVVYAADAEGLRWQVLGADGRPIEGAASDYRRNRFSVADITSLDGRFVIAAYDTERIELPVLLEVDADSGALLSDRTLDSLTDAHSIRLTSDGEGIAIVWATFDIGTTPVTMGTYFAYLHSSTPLAATELSSRTSGEAGSVAFDGEHFVVSYPAEDPDSNDILVGRLTRTGERIADPQELGASAFPTFDERPNDVLLTVQRGDVHGIRTFRIAPGAAPSEAVLVTTPTVNAMLPELAIDGQRAALRWWAWDADHGTRAFLRVFDLCGF